MPSNAKSPGRSEWRITARRAAVRDWRRFGLSGYTSMMSAGDLARFALLYLNHGKWRDRQIVPAQGGAPRGFPVGDLSEGRWPSRHGNDTA